MKLRDFFSSGDARIYGRAHRRLSTVPSGEIVNWALQANVAQQQALEVVLRDRDRAALDEARTGAVAILAACDVLDRTLD